MFSSALQAVFHNFNASTEEFPLLLFLTITTVIRLQMALLVPTLAPSAGLCNEFPTEHIKTLYHARWSIDPHLEN